MKNKCLLQKCTHYKRVLCCSLGKALSSCCTGHTAGRSAMDTLSAFLELISWQKGRATGTSCGTERQPGLGASVRDRVSTRGKGNLLKAASGWGAPSQGKIPTKQRVCAKVLRQEGTKPVGGKEPGITRLCEQVGWELESFNLRSVSTTEEFNQENASMKPPESHHPDWQLLTFCCGTFGKIFWGPYAHKHRPLTCSNVEWDNTVSLLICFSLSTICDGHHFRSVNMDLWHYVSGSLVNHFSKRPQCSWVSADSQLSCFHFPPLVDKPQWPPWHCRVFLPTQQCWILLSSRLWLSQRPGLPLIWRFAVCMLVRLKKT